MSNSSRTSSPAHYGHSPYRSAAGQIMPPRPESYASTGRSFSDRSPVYYSKPSPITSNDPSPASGNATMPSLTRAYPYSSNSSWLGNPTPSATSSNFATSSLEGAYLGNYSALGRIKPNEPSLASGKAAAMASSSQDFTAKSNKSSRESRGSSDDTKTSPPAATNPQYSEPEDYIDSLLNYMWQPN